jgi:hypothetical protein
MSKFLILFLGSVSALFASPSLSIFAKNSHNSQIIAKVPVHDGGLNILRCRGASDGVVWCKVRYRHHGKDITGWSDRKSYDALSTSLKSPTFEKRFGGRYTDLGKAIIVLDDGYLIGGSTQSFGNGQYDAYLIKTDFYGTEKWSTTYGGSGDDTLEAMVAIEKGYLFAGETYSYGNHMPSLYVGRIDTAGMRVWHKGYYLDEDDRYGARSMAKINEEHVMIAGYEEHIKAFNSAENIQLNAVSIDGVYDWTHRYGGKDPEKANSIIRISDGYVIAGVTETWGKGQKDIYVLKIDDAGKRVWHNTFGFKFDEVASQIIATKEGGYIVVGSTSSNHDYSKDIYVVKMDAKGNRQWQGLYGHKDDEEGFGIIEQEDGYVVVGYTKSTKQYDSQVYLVKFNLQGGLVWERTYGGVNEDEGRAIAKTKDGMIITGFSKGGPERGKDIYVLKLDKNGRL